MPLDLNALASISATLDDLTGRISQQASDAHEDDDALVELREVERQLQSCGRRLAKIVRKGLR